MKHIFLFIPQLCKRQTIQSKNPKNVNTHSPINVTGRGISIQEGSLSYSIGQIYYSSHNDQENYVIEAIQQPAVYDNVQNKPELYNTKCLPSNGYALVEKQSTKSANVFYTLVMMR